jgi:acetylornithine deacetylase/succinyl-diaminopimelate desuccinylase-like protein
MGPGRVGRNAIHEMARVSSCWKRATRRVFAGGVTVAGVATVSVGLFSGGTQANIVPDRAAIVVDGARSRARPRPACAGIGRMVAAGETEGGFATAKPVPCRPLETDPSLPWVRQLLGRAGRRRSVGADYFCDAAILAEGGTPSVVFGPGSVAQAHTADEWIALDALEQATAILTRFLRGLP